ncbi:MAG: hypothetical protein IAI48_02040 [Candidatus Eremiobacteraeota bacterium]|nr:hypothetical protein [Candidatus Eremiobacteraeota bacterium]
MMIAAMSLSLIHFAHAMQQKPVQREAVGTELLMDRVGPPSDEAVGVFKYAGMEHVTPHVLTTPERAKVEAVLNSLPSLTKHLLMKKLHRLAFVDGIPGEGTGLTSPVAKTGSYDITLRASIFDESFSTFLTTKERRVFTDDGSGTVVSVEGTGTDALTYVLLHESTHVMDRSCGLTASGTWLVGGIWSVESDLAPQLSSSVAATTIFRGGSRIEVGKAVGLYEALSKTPFVTLYATASSSEDLAELVAWHEIQSQHHGNLIVVVSDSLGNTLQRWEPLTFPGVQKRFSVVDQLLASRLPCSGLSSIRKPTSRTPVRVRRYPGD